MSSNAQLDLLLVNPGGRTSVYQGLGSQLTAVEPPVWAGLIATFARGRGYTVDILDANALNLAPEDIAQRVGHAAPRLCAVVVYGHQPSASTQVMPAAGAACTAIKDISPQTKVLLVGGHVASLPERTLAEETVDFVCTGEGPYTITDLLRALRDGAQTYENVRGLFYADGNTLRRTHPAPLVRNLDAEMAGVAWDLLPMDRYRAHNWECFGGLDRQPYAALYTSLGCPYKCSFCCIQSPFKEGEREAGFSPSANTYRRWSTESVLAQIETLVTKFGVRNFKFADEMFVLNQKHVESICDGIIERDYDLNIWAYARVDSVKAGMVDKLKRAGINWLALGIEAANERVRDNVQKGFGQEDIFRTVRVLRESGINVIANYIFGLPEDDLGSMQETLDLAGELNCEFANFYCAMAYPGSELYREAAREGWDLPGAWSGYSQHGIDTKPLPTKHLTAGQVLRFRDDAFHAYFTNPAYLDMVRAKFGEETVAEIREMTSHTLERMNA